MGGNAHKHWLFVEPSDFRLPHASATLGLDLRDILQLDLKTWRTRTRFSYNDSVPANAWWKLDTIAIVALTRTSSNNCLPAGFAVPGELNFASSSFILWTRFTRKEELAEWLNRRLCEGNSFELA